MENSPGIADRKAVLQLLFKKDLHVCISPQRIEAMCQQGVRMLADLGIEGPLLEGSRIRLSISLPLAKMACTIMLIHHNRNWHVSDAIPEKENGSHRMDVAVIPGKIGVAHMDMEARNNADMMQKYLSILIRSLTEPHEVT